MSSSFDKLVSIMAKLREPGGCPWDHEQTHESILPQLLEETYEVMSAVDDKNAPHLCEELGDLLLHLCFHAQIASEKNHFTMEDVVKGILEKLIRRHPHVFGDVKVENASDVIKNWDAIKAQEEKKHKGTTYLDSVPRALPSLMQAYKLSKKASKVGFDWKNTSDVIQKINEEIEELKQAMKANDKENLEHEVGDLFFALANLCRFIHIQPEEALRKANHRFRDRFAWMEKTIQQKDQKMDILSAPEWDELWNQAKNAQF